MPRTRDPWPDLAAGQMAAFSGLGSLRQLDLDLACTYKILACNANRPEATCLMAEFSSVPSLDGSSPPSPELDFPPRRFIATARQRCASSEMEP